MADPTISDLILPALLEVVLPDVGARNQPVLVVLVGLIDAAEATARAVNDNAWDSAHPLDRSLAEGLAKQCRSIAATLEGATDPVIAGWSLPSMTGKELV